MPQYTLVHEGFWGEWGPEIKVPIGYRVAGFDVRIEARLGADGDDTSMNGIIIRAKSFSSEREQEPIIVEQGLWGDWQERRDIPPSHYICGMEVRMEPPQGRNGDDTALNGIRVFHCPKGGDPLNDRAMLEIESGLWGDWMGPILLPRNHYLSGLKTRFELRQGPHDDDTALNGIIMLSETLPTDWAIDAEKHRNAKLLRALPAKK